jgi:hypothetical protein
MIEPTHRMHDGIRLELTEVEKGHIKDEEERVAARRAQKESEKLARAARKSEILDKLKVTRDEWQLLLQGD